MAGIRTAIALILTAAWTAIVALQVHETWPPFAQPAQYELRDFLMGNSGQLAFFWLVLGYIWLVAGHFQQRAVLRRNSEIVGGAIKQAEAAVRMLEVESRKLDDYQKSRIRAAQPRWEVQGCIAHKEQHEINLRNVGAAASNINAVWDKNLPIVVVLSNARFVDRGQYLTIKVMFHEPRLDAFDLVLDYCDAVDELRRAHIRVADMAVKIDHQEVGSEVGVTSAGIAATSV